uniref:J domain-containing protein n=1 Tax=Globodera rostochiensis TaxID=31243 RepID=A0A914H154_GLORO
MLASVVRIPPPYPTTVGGFSGAECCRCLFRVFVRRCLTFSAPNYRLNDVSAHKNHYETLGVERSASPKNIKAAFFELTKKHHPDMNPEDKVKAAEAFQNITEAYEVLGSEEKRQIYDCPHGKKTTFARFGTAEKQKDWTDLDIDFKDFEHFQQENRRRRMFHDWRRADTTSDFFWHSHQTSKMYKDPRVLEREVLEKRLHAELTERRNRDKMPIPTFEQLYRLEILEKQKRSRKQIKNYVVILPIAFLVFFLYCR